ncbi:MAG TPA: patatin-like phospholipase family protein [Alphaproteobacteria bacterium]|nr:patatin-like phospholipase family protein [Alphaproteobacteria bacterium]
MSAAAKQISLALQGGGTHGAFTWGVLDRLLADERIDIRAISGTSAGAMNGAMLTYGMMEGGREGARAALSRFWRKVGETARFSPFQPTWLDQLLGEGGLDFSPPYVAADFLSRVMSPYETTLFDMNPLRELLSQYCDFDRVNACRSPQLHVCATHVLSGKIRVFAPGEITVEAVLASACLPHMFRAVEIDGEYYWDGGFVGNPPMYPLIRPDLPADMVLVAVNPIHIDRLPRSAREIIDRTNEISFNANVMREMRTIDLITRMLEKGHLGTDAEKRRLHLHMIGAERDMARYGASSKFNAHPEFLDQLFALGRRTAEAWLKQHYGRLGSASTLDVKKIFV